MARRTVDCEGVLGRALTSRSLRVHPILRVKGPLRVYRLMGGDDLLSFLPSFVSRGCIGSKRVGELSITNYPMAM